MPARRDRGTTLRWPRWQPIKDEAISQAVERTVSEFDDLEKDGYVDRNEFIEHMVKIGVVVPENTQGFDFFTGF